MNKQERGSIASMLQIARGKKEFKVADVLVDVLVVGLHPNEMKVYEALLHSPHQEASEWTLVEDTALPRPTVHTILVELKRICLIDKIDEDNLYYVRDNPAPQIPWEGTKKSSGV